MVMLVAQPREVIRVIESVLGSKECQDAWKYFAPARAGLLAIRWARLVENGNGICLSLVEDGRTCGFLLGLVSEDLITGILQALEYLWVVLPSSRKGAASLQLLDAFTAVARARGCQQVIVGSSTYQRPAAMRRLYRRLGFSPHAEAFRKDI